METEKELNEKIFRLTLKIEEKYPELYRSLGEMPVTIPKEQLPQVNAQALAKYYDSLQQLLDNYLLEHPELKGK